MENEIINRLYELFRTKGETVSWIWKGIISLVSCDIDDMEEHIM